MAIIYTDLTDSIIIEHNTLDEYILHIAPVFRHWRLTIIMDSFFPCDMGKCRKLCKMLYDYLDYECMPLFISLYACLQDIFNKNQDKGCDLSYIKRMKKNIDYIERMAKDG